MRIIKRIGSASATFKLDCAPCRKIGDMYFFQPAAILERITSDACHAVGNGNARKSAATIKRITSDACYAVRNNKVGNKHIIQIYVVRIIKRIGIVIIKLDCAPCRKVADMYFFQPAAILERITSDACHAVPDRHARQSVATLESIFPDARDAIPDAHACQSVTT